MTFVLVLEKKETFNKTNNFTEKNCQPMQPKKRAGGKGERSFFFVTVSMFDPLRSPSSSSTRLCFWIILDEYDEKSCKYPHYPVYLFLTDLNSGMYTFRNDFGQRKSFNVTLSTI